MQRSSHWLILVCLPWVADCPSALELRQVQAVVGLKVMVGLLDCARERLLCEQHGLLSKAHARFYSQG